MIGRLRLLSWKKILLCFERQHKWFSSFCLIVRQLKVLFKKFKVAFNVNLRSLLHMAIFILFFFHDINASKGLRRYSSTTQACKNFSFEHKELYRKKTNGKTPLVWNFLQKSKMKTKNCPNIIGARLALEFCVFKILKMIEVVTRSVKLILYKAIFRRLETRGMKIISKLWFYFVTKLNLNNCTFWRDLYEN